MLCLWWATIISTGIIIALLLWYAVVRLHTDVVGVARSICRFNLFLYAMPSADTAFCSGFAAIRIVAHLSLRTVSIANAAFNSHPIALGMSAFFFLGAVFAAKSTYLNIIGALRIPAPSSLGTMQLADATAHDIVSAISMNAFSLMQTRTSNDLH
mmetsp:Transcript_10541/g.15218  ORF Transcript_10541/g.15218 Transcript_10541/m.15218 type:complete len:155 (-) Transcript_10541:38-502(-)